MKDHDNKESQKEEQEEQEERIDPYRYTKSLDDDRDAEQYIGELLGDEK